jgi:hypothetical protein
MLCIERMTEVLRGYPRLPDRFIAVLIDRVQTCNPATRAVRRSNSNDGRSR